MPPKTGDHGMYLEETKAKKQWEERRIKSCTHSRARESHGHAQIRCT